MAWLYYSNKGDAEAQQHREMARLAEEDAERFLAEVDAVLETSALQARRYVVKGGE